MDIPVTINKEELIKEIKDELRDEVSINVTGVTYAVLKNEVDEMIWKKAKDKLGLGLSCKEKESIDAERWFDFYRYCVKTSALSFLNENKSEIIEKASKDIAEKMCNCKTNKSEIISRLLELLYE